MMIDVLLFSWSSEANNTLMNATKLQNGDNDDNDATEAQCFCTWFENTFVMVFENPKT